MPWIDSAVQCSQTGEHNIFVRMCCTLFTDRRKMSFIESAVQCSQTENNVLVRQCCTVFKDSREYCLG
jgi:hypothetical protein